MSDENKERLHSVLRDLVNSRQEQAEITLHDYFSEKSKEVLGLGAHTEPKNNDFDDNLGDD